jgi:CRISPR-associated endoribonuclease Cas6
VTFDFFRYSFQFCARERLSFSAYGPGNWLRGKFGAALREIACFADCPGRSGVSVRHCGHRADCAYARIFEPVSAEGPSGLADPPRPFVFRVAHLAKRSLSEGDEFCVDVNVFGSRFAETAEFAGAFGKIAQAELIASSCSPASVNLDPRSEGTTGLRVRFLTPTELKNSSDAAPENFSTLFARARDRVSTLRALYGVGPLEIDFRGMGERARSIRLTRSNLKRITAERRSSRTRQVHGVGGFVGEVDYAGQAAEFLPILEAARATGVGRHCVWGNGEIAAEVI